MIQSLSTTPRRPAFGTTPPDTTEGAVARVEQALRSAEPDAVVVVDLDETLFLSNSTERFLDQARPRLIAAVVLAVLAVLRPWRWKPFRHGSHDPDFTEQDAWRVGLVRLLLPGTLRRWKRQAAEEMGRLENRALADLLNRSGRRIAVATYGLRQVAEPLLAAASIRADLVVAAPHHRSAAWRRRGKAHAAAQALGEASLKQAVVITDSPRDQDLLDLAGHPVLVQWPDAQNTPAQSSVYLPLVYLSRVKRQGAGALVREVLLDDFALLLLALIAVNPLTPGSLLGLAAAFLAFFCIYEIGYRENDRLDAAFSNKPRLSDNFFQRPDLCRCPGAAPWAWAAVLTGVAAWALHSPWLGAESALAWPAPAYTFGLWAGLLVVTRLIFGVYNRLDETSRVFVFPWLQASKTFGFLLLLPTAAAGALFMGAQVFRRWMHYACYRAGGDGKALPSHTTRFVAFLLLSAGYVAATGHTALFSHWHYWLILAWISMRGGSHLFGSVCGIRWRSRRSAQPAHPAPPTPDLFTYAYAEQEHHETAAPNP